MGKGSVPRVIHLPFPSDNTRPWCNKAGGKGAWLSSNNLDEVTCSKCKIALEKSIIKLMDEELKILMFGTLREYKLHCSRERHRKYDKNKNNRIVGQYSEEYRKRNKHIDMFIDLCELAFDKGVAEYKEIEHKMHSKKEAIRCKERLKNPEYAKFHKKSRRANYENMVERFGGREAFNKREREKRNANLEHCNKVARESRRKRDSDPEYRAETNRKAREYRKDKMKDPEYRKKLNKRSKIYRDKNREKINEISSRNYYKNHEETKKKRREYYHKNVDEIKVRQKRYKNNRSVEQVEKDNINKSNWHYRTTYGEFAEMAKATRKLEKTLMEVSNEKENGFKKSK